MASTPSRELIDSVNQDPRRGVGHEKVLTRLELDAQAQKMLERAGLTAEAVPPKGQVVYLRSTANLSTGGTATDVTDVIHPDNREMAERAVRAIGLDVGGVDFLSKNITESYRRIGGGICEVNAAPGLPHARGAERGHAARRGGTGDRHAVSARSAPSRVPIAAITGTNGKTTTARMLAHITKMAGFTPGLTTTDGVYIDGQRTVPGDMTGPVSARMVLADPQIDIAVLETARGGLLRAGMGVNEVNVGAVLNVQPDHLGLKGIDTLEQLAEVKRIVVEVASDCAVLNADDPLVLKMSGYTEAKHICYVTLNPQHALVREHIRAGGRACALEAGVNGQMITLYDKGAHIPLLWTHLIPATLEGRATHNVQNAMFAAAMAFSLGIKLDAIRQGLRTFDATFFQAPGRMNVFDEHPFKVLFDYGHNAHAVAAHGGPGAAPRRDRPPHRGARRTRRPPRRGPRRDRPARLPGASITTSAAATTTCANVHPMRCRASRPRRSRPPACPRRRSRSSRTSRRRSTPRSTWAAPGDLLLIFADALVRSWKQITKFRPAGDGRAPNAGACLRERGGQLRRGRAEGRRAGRAGLQPRGPDPRRARDPLRTGGRRLNADTGLPFDASRRLTGPNLFFVSTGAQLETSGIAPDEALLAGWRARVERARAYLGWHAPGVVARRHAGGVSLALAAPADQLFVATEVNEWALCATLAAADPSCSAALEAALLAEVLEDAAEGAQVLPPVLEEGAALARLAELASREARPALMALIGAARRARAAARTRRRHAHAGGGQRRRRFFPGCTAAAGRGAVGRAARRADRHRDRLERQDHHGAAARGLRARARLAERLLLHRRGVLRGQRPGERRLLRPGGCAPRHPRARRAGGDHRDGPRRHPAARTGDLAGARRGGDQRQRRSFWRVRHR